MPDAGGASFSTARPRSGRRWAPVEWRVVLEPKSLAQWIIEIREGLVCSRCGVYVGSLAPKRYLPPPYPVALDKITSDDEVEALIGFEAHMIGRIRAGNFRISHPQVDGRCASFREWIESDDDEVEPEVEA